MSRAFYSNTIGAINIEMYKVGSDCVHDKQNAIAEFLLQFHTDATTPRAIGNEGSGQEMSLSPPDPQESTYSTLCSHAK